MRTVTLTEDGKYCVSEANANCVHAVEHASVRRALQCMVYTYITVHVLWYELL